MKSENDKHPEPHEAEGWWEYGVGGVTQFRTGHAVEPRASFSRLAAEIEAERVEKLYVVRRRVFPGVWERVEPDDHPGVDDYTWQQYLEWREKSLRAEADRTRAARESADPPR